MKRFALLLILALLSGCAQTPPSAPQSSVTPVPPARPPQIPTWLLLRPGARFHVDVAPWPGGTHDAALMPTVNAYEAYINGNSPARSLGQPVGVAATVVTGKLVRPSYGGGGALLDAYVELRGDGWHGFTTFSHMVPIVPSGTHLIIDDRDIPAYDSLESLTSIGTFPSGAGVIVHQIDFNSTDTNATHLARALVSTGAFTHEVWVEADQLAIRGMRPSGADASSVTEECDCTFLQPIALANVYNYVGQPTDIALVHHDIWKTNAGGADLWDRPRDFCAGVMTAAGAIANGQHEVTTSVHGRSDVVGNATLIILGHAVTVCPQTSTRTPFTHVRVDGRTGWILSSATHPT